VVGGNRVGEIAGWRGAARLEDDAAETSRPRFGEELGKALVTGQEVDRPRSGQRFGECFWPVQIGGNRLDCGWKRRAVLDPPHDRADRLSGCYELRDEFPADVPGSSGDDNHGTPFEPAGN
jgi:hypothetical protein